MKPTLTLLISFFILSATAQKIDKDKIKSNLKIQQYITAYDFTNKEVLVKYTSNLERILTGDRGPEECNGGRFTDSATNTFLNLPNPGRAVMANDLTEGTPGAGSFTLACTAGSLQACVSRPYNPRYFNPGSPMQIYYGRCYGIPIGKIRGCQTAYGWRIEGDMNMDNIYEGVLKITLQ